jgi:hypothetical protein
MIYDMSKPEHLAHFLNELPTKKIMQEHGRFYAKRKSAEFMAEVKKHMLEKTEIVSAKIQSEENKNAVS